MVPYKWHLWFFVYLIWFWIGNQCTTVPFIQSLHLKRHHERKKNLCEYGVYLLLCISLLYLRGCKVSDAWSYFKQRMDAKCVFLANAISCVSWTALKGTSGWKVSLLLHTLKQWRITAVAFGWRWFSMELDGLYRIQLGPVWQSYSSC